MLKCLAHQLQAKPMVLNKDSVVAIASGWLSTIRIPVHPLNKELAPLQVGDVLFVKEHWNEWKQGDYFYLADATLKGSEFCFGDEEMMGFEHASSMPDEAARFFLVIQSVKKQRIQEITIEEMEEELVGYKEVHPIVKNSITPHEAFALRWNRHHTTKDGYPSWNSNPEVWVYTFKVVDASELETKEE